MGDKSTGPGDGLGDAMQMWFDMAAAAMAPFQGRTDAPSAPEALKQAREVCFQAWSESCAEFLRSPAFLAAQKKLMKGNLEYRKKVRQTLERLHHEFELPTCEDIDRLVTAIEQLDRRVEEQFEELTDRLGKLAARIEALAPRRGDPKRSDSAPPERPTKRRPRAE
jgi:hypothetical protein